MTDRIDILEYPGLEDLYYLSQEGLHAIEADGGLKPMTDINTRLGDMLSWYFRAHRLEQDENTFGWFLPVSEHSADTPWKEYCTLKLSSLALSNLKAFEQMVEAHIKMHDMKPREELAENMSALEGMRRLSAYGLALGFIPMVGSTEEGNLIAVRLEEEEHKKELIDVLKELITQSHLFDGCDLKALFEDFATC